MAKHTNPSRRQALCGAASLAFLYLGLGGGVANAEAAPSTTVDEVIVTANRFAQNVQDVPLAISALDAKALEARGITGAQDLQFATPNLTIGRTNANQAQVTIRGIGTENIAVGGDPGVTIYVDGHYVPAPSFVTQDFYDIDRVEVLRGPQGTLYGRNAIGGAINIITKRPASGFEGNVGAQVSNYDGWQVQGVLSGPIAGGLSARLVGVRNHRDGFITNLTTGERVDKSDYTALRGELLLNPNQDIDILLGGYNYENRGNLPDVVVSPYNLGNPIPNTFGIPNPFVQAGRPDAVNPTVSNRSVIRNDVSPRSFDKSAGLSLDATFRKGAFTVKSLTSYNRANTSTERDIDGSDIVFTRNQVGYEFNSYSQELQFLYDTPTLHVIGGLYGYDEKSKLDFVFHSYNFFTGTTPPTTDTAIFGTARTRSFGAYTQTNWQFRPKWELVAGVRYSWDRKLFEAVNDYRALFFYAETPAGSRESWDNVSGRLGINYHPTQDVMLYASLASGYKSGGFNIGFPFSAYRPEKVLNVEAGIKSELLERRLRLNATVFHGDYKDKQDFNIVGGLPVMLNASSATIYGLEADARLRVTGNLTLDATGALLHAEYDRFSTVDVVFPALGVQDLSGNRLARSPKYTLALGAQYETDLGAYGSISTRVDRSFTSDIYYRAFNTTRDRVGAYHRTNARVTWTHPNRPLSVAAYVNNIENERVIENLLISDNNLGANTEAEFLPPRTYGLRIGYSF